MPICGFKNGTCVTNVVHVCLRPPLADRQGMDTTTPKKKRKCKKHNSTMTHAKRSQGQDEEKLQYVKWKTLKSWNYTVTQTKDKNTTNADTKNRLFMWIPALLTCHCFTNSLCQKSWSPSSTISSEAHKPTQCCSPHSNYYLAWAQRLHELPSIAHCPALMHLKCNSDVAKP